MKPIDMTTVTIAETFDGMLFDWGSNKYYDSIDEFVEDWWCDNHTETDVPLEYPEEYFLFCTKPVHPMKIDIDYIYQQIEEVAFIDEDYNISVIDLLKGKDELEAAIDAFNELNKDVILGYEYVTNRAIRLTTDDFKE